MKLFFFYSNWSNVNIPLAKHSTLQNNTKQNKKKTGRRTMKNSKHHPEAQSVLSSGSTQPLYHTTTAPHESISKCPECLQPS